MSREVGGRATMYIVHTCTTDLIVSPRVSKLSGT